MQETIFAAAPLADNVDHPGLCVLGTELSPFGASVPKQRLLGATLVAALPVDDVYHSGLHVPRTVLPALRSGSSEARSCRASWVSTFLADDIDHTRFCVPTAEFRPFASLSKQALLNAIVVATSLDENVDHVGLCVLHTKLRLFSSTFPKRRVLGAGRVGAPLVEDIPHISFRMLCAELWLFATFVAVGGGLGAPFLPTLSHHLYRHSLRTDVRVDLSRVQWDTCTPRERGRGRGSDSDSGSDKRQSRLGSSEREREINILGRERVSTNSSSHSLFPPLPYLNILLYVAVSLPSNSISRLHFAAGTVTHCRTQV